MFLIVKRKIERMSDFLTNGSLAWFVQPGQAVNTGATGDAVDADWVPFPGIALSLQDGSQE